MLFIESICSSFVTNVCCHNSGFYSPSTFNLTPEAV